jgi:hypothetical protein
MKIGEPHSRSAGFATARALRDTESNQSTGYNAGQHGDDGR